ncbi:MAG: hypothetical protein GY861_21940 [bacterium]|nr:hypothetical protein [bacterium]
MYIEYLDRSTKLSYFYHYEDFVQSCRALLDENCSVEGRVNRLLATNDAITPFPVDAFSVCNTEEGCVEARYFWEGPGFYALHSRLDYDLWSVVVVVVPFDEDLLSYELSSCLSYLALFKEALSFYEYEGSEGDYSCVKIYGLSTNIMGFLANFNRYDSYVSYYRDILKHKILVGSRAFEDQKKDRVIGWMSGNRSDWYWMSVTYESLRGCFCIKSEVANPASIKHDLNTLTARASEIEIALDFLGK